MKVRVLNLKHVIHSEAKQVFITALEGFVPIDIIKTLNVYLDFCYIAQKDVFTEDSLDALDNALGRFHHYCKIFQECGICPTGFLLPHQHSLIHYHHHIEKFGALNRVSSSITKSKHTAAVKKPWCQSSHYEALKRILAINTRNNKLAAARINFSSHGMLNGTCLSEALRTIGYSSNQHDGDVSDNQTSVNPKWQGTRC